MEVIVLEDSPLATYLEGEGQNSNHSATFVSRQPESPSLSYAPKGRPILSRFKPHIISSLWLETPRSRVTSAISNLYSRTLDPGLSRADNARFLERFRYLIVASQLLNLQTYPSHTGNKSTDLQVGDKSPSLSLTVAGAGITALFAFLLAWSIHWVRSGANSIIGIGRIIVLFTVVGAFGVIFYAYLQRRWLQRLRHDTLAELSELILAAYNIDNAAASALSLIQEVELVSRGYQIGSPLPPVSRIEDRNQIRLCSRLRRKLRDCFIKVQAKYVQSCRNLQPLAERLDLEKYYDIYDISDIDLSEILSEKPEIEPEELESIRALKILAARYNVIRKFFLCCLMALDANETKNDLHRWNVAMEEIHMIRLTTASAAEELAISLNEDESSPISPTSKTTQLPGRERWRAQSRQLSLLSSGIRGLQAKLQLLKEESDRRLNESEDLSDFGSNLMIQYESLGLDLKGLVQEWEDGKSALSSNLDRNERRISCFSGVVSPTASLGGLTVVEEGGGALDALKALNGEMRSRSSIDFSTSDFEEVFETVAMPLHRGSMSREERIAKMKDDRVKRYSARYSQENNTKILRELESVIRMRPRNSLSVSTRVSSL
ncbi:hypothetical protein HI914_01583 [Erysiphe necator]|nr:hypothetical protein HI914_01583 [Erysiphe necator]